MQIKEAHFYKICDTVEKIPPLYTGYFPQPEELTANNVEKYIEEFLPFLLYFDIVPIEDMASHPLYVKSISEIRGLLRRNVEII